MSHRDISTPAGGDSAGSGPQARSRTPYSPRQKRGRWWLAWAVSGLLGALSLTGLELERQRAVFQTDARIAHRLLSQRAAQHDAILTMLVLLQPETVGENPMKRLPAIYTQLLRVERRSRGESWPPDLAAAGLADAEADSRRLRHATSVAPRFDAGRSWLVLAAEPQSYALELDLRGLVPEQEWPAALIGATDVSLVFGSARFMLNQSASTSGLSEFSFRKTLSVDSQPYQLVVASKLGWANLPWLAILLWNLACAAMVVAHFRYHRLKQSRERAEARLRLDKAARLNALGELAAGLAHELNQPLTAVLANTQAAGRLLDDEPADLVSARDAMKHAAVQARRAADVLARLRRTVEQPGISESLSSLSLFEAVGGALELLASECRAHQVAVHLEGDNKLKVSAEPVALQQIIHNLINNALQAMEQVPETQRRLDIDVVAEAGRISLSIADSGPGIAGDLLPRVFEPFYTTRSDGLGLGLSLSETLAENMGASLTAGHSSLGGALFILSFPESRAA